MFVSWRVRSFLIRFKDRAGLFVGYRLPRWVRYWAVIDAAAKATTGQYSNTNPNDLGVMELLRRIEG